MQTPRCKRTRRAVSDRREHLLPLGPTSPNSGSFLWSVAPFDASISCGKDMSPDLDGYVALGPAITFGPGVLAFKREIPLSIPLNPARMPASARWRHLRIAYKGPGFLKARTHPGRGSPRRESKRHGRHRLRDWNRLAGELQGAAPRDLPGGRARRRGHARRISRRLTHRAVIGVSMGGGGAAMFGLRHHDLFDVDGAARWPRRLDVDARPHREQPPRRLPPDPVGHPARRRPRRGGLPDERRLQGRRDLSRRPRQPAHAGQVRAAARQHRSLRSPVRRSTPGGSSTRAKGTGGRFPRAEYSQIFRDLALMFGNPNGDNLSPGGRKPARRRSTRRQERPRRSPERGVHRCGSIDPARRPGSRQAAGDRRLCPHERCAHTLTLDGYYDDEYNPDGIFPVITVCDGSPQNEALSPYANTWTPSGNDYPLEVGARRRLQRQRRPRRARADHPRRPRAAGTTTATTAMPSSKEPGYSGGVERRSRGRRLRGAVQPGRHRGRPSLTRARSSTTSGSTASPGTQQQPARATQNPGDGYDVGEGDGKFTVSHGLQRFWDRDAHSIVRAMVDPKRARRRRSRRRARADRSLDRRRHARPLQLRGRRAAPRRRFRARATATSPTSPTSPQATAGPRSQSKARPTTSPRIVLRGPAGHRDAALRQDRSHGRRTSRTAAASTSARRTRSRARSRRPSTSSARAGREPELRQLGSRRRPRTSPPTRRPTRCEVAGDCTVNFTIEFGRAGPVGITLPPGYANAEQQRVRYPVIYMLHGYGQSPRGSRGRDRVPRRTG